MSTPADQTQTQLTQLCSQLSPDSDRLTDAAASTFTEADIADIICILYPASPNAEDELQLLADANSPYVLTNNTYRSDDKRFSSQPDDAVNFTIVRPIDSHNIIVLKLSHLVKDATLGAIFGRNASRADICLVNDPGKRISNAHFGIYVNEHGTVMLEDRSTNGTIVDNDVLKSRAGNPDFFQRTLTSGSRIKILMMSQELDLVFTVRIPKREGDAADAYMSNVAEYTYRREQAGLEAKAKKAQMETKKEPPKEKKEPPQKRLTARTPSPPPAQHSMVPPPIPKQPPRTGPPARGGALPQARVMGPPPTRAPPSRTIVSSSSSNRPWDGGGKYNIGPFLGNGAFATVYKVTNRYTGHPHAAKQMDYSKFIRNGTLDQKVVNEMNIMRSVAHNNIVRFVDHANWQNRLFIIIMEFVPGGDLGKFVVENGTLPERLGQSVAVQMLGALDYLHSKNITHRDVKPDNILIAKLDPFTVKLTDFGLSKMVDNEQTFLRTFCGTLLYCAPEVYSEYAEYDSNGNRHPQNRYAAPRGQRYGPLVDVWSLGGVLFFVMTKCPPFPAPPGINHSQLLHTIMTQPLNIYPLRMMQISDCAVFFLQEMLQRRPEHRTAICDLLKHQWLNPPAGSFAEGESFESLGWDEELVEVSEIREVTNQQAGDVDDVYDDVDMSSGFMDKFMEPGYDGVENRRPPEVMFGDSGVLPVLGDRESKYHSALDLPEGYDAVSKAGGDAQSADQVLSLVEGVASQTLDQSDSEADRQEESPNDEVNGGVGKRKANFSSEEDMSLQEFHTQKKLRPELSEGSFPQVSSAAEAAELRLIAQVPPIPTSGRQIDAPVHKMRFWGDELSTHHLYYPEMTQQQMLTFKSAAVSRREVFEPDSTPLWDVAMKFFPPAPGSSEIWMPEMELATFQSAVGSSLQGISIPMKEGAMSWGRSPENLVQHKELRETRIPKTAFKVLVHGGGYDVGGSRREAPWRKDGNLGKEVYFYLSSKATRGVYVNGVHVPSDRAGEFATASKYWMKIYTGDEVLIWGTEGHECSKLAFTCQWGGSSYPRPSDVPTQLVTDETLLKALDEQMLRGEVKLRDTRGRTSDFKAVEEAANREHEERVRGFEKEVEASLKFEKVRKRAVRFVEMEKERDQGI